jgi:hypothetical protein
MSRFFDHERSEVNFGPVLIMIWLLILISGDFKHLLAITITTLRRPGGEHGKLCRLLFMKPLFVKVGHLDHESRQFPLRGF